MEQAAYESMRDLQENHWWFVGRRRFLERLIERKVTLPANARILEAGCGYGGNLSLLGQFGNVSAFEFDESARKFASEQSGISVAHGKLPEAPGFDNEKFDLIAILDVLEHLDDDHNSLVALRKRLAPTGTLLISVPAIPWLWSRHDEIHHHKRRYMRKQLIDRVADAGLNVFDAGYFNSLLFPLALAQRSMAKLTDRDSGTEELPAPLNSVFKAIFSTEAAIASKFRFPIGLSLYALANVPNG